MIVGFGGIQVGGFYRCWFRFNMLLGLFCRANFCGSSALERQEMAMGAVELEVKGHFISVECVEAGCGLQDSGESNGWIGGFRADLDYGCI